ncbi:hypothetical protein ElyMa_002442800 [Elysia marginata]|uniref:Mutator-like transposase domain-containing protein n=1 Tax=Elysia marginata TaxID=1093978 RepID=A0AAV4GKC5_9GAST|nr:hypothetical protein ElyMa_002442800 [Elysia marginata]
MMEVKAAEVLWKRSVERHKMRYTTMVSDGDFKAHTRLLEVQPYGPEEKIEKEDCINHVGKTLGAALRNIDADCSKKGITIRGRGRSRLTHEAIRKLQIYYGRAIRSASSSEEIRRNILASIDIYHRYSEMTCLSTSTAPPGPSSWCFFKRSIGEHRYPTGHKNGFTPLSISNCSKSFWSQFTKGLHHCSS